MIRLFLAVISVLVPGASRQRWLEEWQAEIHHARRRGAGPSFAAGSIRDAFAMRRQARIDAPVPSRLLHGLGRDFRYAARGLAASRTFVVGVVCSLAVGIGATSASFGFMHAVMFRTFPGVENQDGLARVTVNRSCGWPGCWIQSSTVEDYRLVAEAMPSLSALTASASGAAAIRIGADAHSVRAAAVSTNYFATLGITPVLGRRFLDSESSAPDASVAIISHSLWKRLFDGSPAALGRFIELAGRPVQIVGVMPQYAGTPKGNMQVGGSNGVELFVPLDLAPLFIRPATFAGGRRLPDNEYSIEYLGRLAPGNTLANAQRDSAVATTRFRAAHDASYADGWVEAGGVVNDPRSASVMLANFMLVPLIVLAIACVNAANMVLARGSERARDVAVRLALGASRWRVMRELSVESLLLALTSGLLAVPLIAWLHSLAEAAVGVPVVFGGPAIAFTIFATLASAAGFSLVPTLRAIGRGTAPLGSSRSGDAGPGRMRVRRVLVVVQVSLSLGLLATGSQVIGAVGDLSGHTGAADPERLFMASFDLDQLKLPPATGEAFYAALLERASGLPGVERAALARRSALWTWGRGVGASPVVVWRPGASPKDGRLLLGGYTRGNLFGTVGLHIVEGRAFGLEDSGGLPRAAIVSRAFADGLGGSAIGQTIRVAARGQAYEQAQDVRIVGVVEAASDPAYTKEPLSTVYLPAPLAYEPALTLYLRLRAGSDPILPSLTALVRELNPRVPVAELTTVAALTERRHFEERVMGQALALLGALALALAGGGLYAVASFIVAARRRELGIRLALGATPAELLGFLMRQSLGLAATGAAIGFAIALGLGAVAHAEIVGVPSINVRLFLAAAVILIAVMGVASAVPARRAARVSPLTVLRQE